MSHEDKGFHSGGGHKRGDKHSEIYDEPMPKKCNHPETWSVYNVLTDSNDVKCKSCGERLDK